MKNLKISKQEILNIFEWISVIIVAFFMGVYGIAKPTQFSDPIGYYTKPINTLEPMQLMWTFYSYSKPYVIIIGFFEVMGAILLLIPKTRLVGGLVLTTVLLNIILQDHFYQVHVGAMANAVFYQLLIFGIFLIHWQKIVAAFSALKLNFKFRFRWIYLLIGIVAYASIELLLFLINKALLLTR